MVKKITLGLLVTSLFITLAFVSLIAKVTWDQHQDTKDWQNTSLAGDLKDVPPFLARNYIKAEDKKAVESWQRVAGLLKQIETEEGTANLVTEDMEQILKESRDYQKAYQLDSGDIAEQNDRLRLYLDTEAALASAYDTPADGVLRDVTSRLYTMQVLYPCPLHERYFEKLQAVAKDYANLSAFLENTFSSLGTTEEKTLLVKKSAGEKQTGAIQKQIEEQELAKFPFVAKLDSLLKGNLWGQILNRNKITRDYDTWQEAKGRMEAFSKSMYYSLADITTYQQALDAGLSVKVKEKDGYSVSLDSPVDVILYKGTPVGSGQYIRHGTEVKVLLHETYTELPREPEPPEEPSAPEEPSPPAENTPSDTETPAEPEQPDPVIPPDPDDGWDDTWGEPETKPAPDRT